MHFVTTYRDATHAKLTRRLEWPIFEHKQDCPLLTAHHYCAHEVICVYIHCMYEPIPLKQHKEIISHVQPCRTSPYLITWPSAWSNSAYRTLLYLGGKKHSRSHHCSFVHWQTEKINPDLINPAMIESREGICSHLFEAVQKTAPLSVCLWLIYFLNGMRIIFYQSFTETRLLNRNVPQDGNLNGNIWQFYEVMLSQ